MYDASYQPKPAYSAALSALGGSSSGGGGNGAGSGAIQEGGQLAQGPDRDRETTYHAKLISTRWT
jgi:hypothetical protein